MCFASSTGCVWLAVARTIFLWVNSLLALVWHPCCCQFLHYGIHWWSRWTVRSRTCWNATLILLCCSLFSEQEGQRHTSIAVGINAFGIASVSNRDVGPLSESFHPGVSALFGLLLVTEAAAHATRRFIANLQLVLVITCCIVTKVIRCQTSDDNGCCYCRTIVSLAMLLKDGCDQCLWLPAKWKQHIVWPGVWTAIVMTKGSEGSTDYLLLLEEWRSCMSQNEWS